MKPFRITIIVVVALIIGVIIYNKFIHPAPNSSSKPKTANDKISVEGMVASLSKNKEVISSSGTVLAENEVEIKSEVQGRVVQLNISEGENIQKGALLCKIYDVDLQANRQKIQAQIGLAKSNFSRLEPLEKVQGVSALEFDNAKNQLSLLQADMALINSQIQKTEIRAPFSGRIGLRNISNGMIINPNTLITTLEDKSSLKLSFSVPEKYSSSIKNGNLVYFVPNGGRDSFKATIYAMDSRIDQNDRTIQVRAKVLTGKDEVIPGSFANVYIQSRERESIMIPANAVISIGRVKKVMISKNGKAFPQPIETGVRTSEVVEIIKGLNVGDTVVTTGILFVKPEMTLVFKNFKNGTGLNNTNTTNSINNPNKK